MTRKMLGKRRQWWMMRVAEEEKVVDAVDDKEKEDTGMEREGMKGQSDGNVSGGKDGEERGGLTGVAGRQKGASSAVHKRNASQDTDDLGDAPLSEVLLCKEEEEEDHRSLRVSVDIAGVPVEAVVDSGTGKSLLSLEVFNSLPASLRKKLQPSNKQFCGYNGVSSSALGFLVVPVTVAGVKTNAGVFVCSSLVQDLLLGTKWMTPQLCGPARS